MTYATHAPPAAGASVRPPASRALLLVAGSALIFLTFLRYGLPELSWVAFAPFLAYLHERGTIRRHLAVLAALVVGFLAAFGKMVTPEVPWAIVPVFAVPIAFSYFLAVAVASAAHRRLGARWGVYTFASMAVVLGWLQYTFTTSGSVGVLAHTQLDNLPLVQLAALTGIGGITFLVALGSGLAAAAWRSGLMAVRADLALFGLLLVGALLYGQLRLGSPAPGTPVRVGAVISPVTHTDLRAAFANADALRPLDDELFARSARAADLGAKVVVWNELATLVSADGESGLDARGRAFARERAVMLVMAYGVVQSVRPLHDANKYRVYLPDGTMADEYLKRHPVPGDPDEAGTAHARVVDFGGTRYSGAICYDYDFPEIARDNARDGAGLVLVPSSDWRGIDPWHPLMARMSAVADGLTMVRPVRGATSIASDQFGRVLGSSLRADGENDGAMVVAVPGERVPTVYASTGEVVPLVALAFSVLAVVQFLRPRRVTQAIPRMA
jgi:apolipoprotein N-acyltransferase